MERKDRRTLVLGAVAGTAIWAWAMLGAGGREIWDLPVFWSHFYPAALLVAGLLGLLPRSRPWLCAAAIFLPLLPVIALAGGGFGLLPLGVAMIVILAVPGAALAWVAARATALFR